MSLHSICLEILRVVANEGGWDSQLHALVLRKINIGPESEGLGKRREQNYLVISMLYAITSPGSNSE